MLVYKDFNDWRNTVPSACHGMAKGKAESLFGHALEERIEADDSVSSLSFH